MNISNHFFERYAERISGLINKSDIKHYIVQNKEILTNNILKMYEHAQFLWKGQLFDNITRNYYIVDDIILITDTGDTALITLFKISLPYPNAAVKSIIKETTKEVSKLLELKEEKQSKVNEILDKNKQEADDIQFKIRNIEEQIRLLKDKQEFLKSENQTVQNDVVLLNKQIEEYILPLVNSLEHKNELKKII